MTRPGPEGYDPFDTSTPADGAYRGSLGETAPTAGSGGYAGGYGPGPGYGAGYQGGAAYAPAPNVPTGRGMAIAALILGVISVPATTILIGGLLAVIAIILAVFALRAGAKARKLGSNDTGPTTAMSIIGILASVLALAVFAFIVFIAMAGVDVGMQCQHLINDQAAFDACVEGELLDRFGVN